MRRLADLMQILRRSAALAKLIMPSSGMASLGAAQRLAHFAHADRRPGLAVSSLAAYAVERYGDATVAPSTGEHADRFYGARRRGRPVGPRPIFTRGARSSLCRPPDQWICYTTSLAASNERGGTTGGCCWFDARRKGKIT
jgi:hypothetical protein